MWTISLLTRPAGTLPGQRMMNGARSEPSIAVKYVPRHGPLSPSQGLVASGPLSLVKIDQRVVFDAGFLDGVEDLAGAVVHLGQAIGPIAVAGLAGELRIGQRRHVNQRERNVGIERLGRRRVALDELHGAAS